MLYQNITKSNFMFYSVDGVKTTAGFMETIDSEKVPDVVTNPAFVPYDPKKAAQPEQVAVAVDNAKLNALEQQIAAAHKELAKLRADLNSVADSVVPVIKAHNAKAEVKEEVKEVKKTTREKE